MNKDIEDNFLDAIGDVYADTKSQFRREYNRRAKQYQKKDKFKEEMRKLMIPAGQGIGFATDINQDEDKRYAFTEALRQIHKKTNVGRPIVKAIALDGTYKYFTLSDKHNIESTLGHITGELDLSEDQSDTNPYISNMFIPVRYEVQFIDMNKTNDGVHFRTKMQDMDTHEIYDDEVEIDEDYRNTPEGSFFPYINLSPIDLSTYQIFHEVRKENYRDNCFVYACIQSGVFTDDEIDDLRFFVQTRTIPNNKIEEVAKKFKCNFSIIRVVEQPDKYKYETRINTRKKKWSVDFKREVKLILFKDHYMLNKNIPCTLFYLQHYEELDRTFAYMPFEKRCMIYKLHSNRKTVKEYNSEGIKPITFFQKMFELHLFEEIKACEMDIINTTEYEHVNDYVSLEYNAEQCTRLIENNKKKQNTWSRIYYSDFETNSTVSPHIPYLNCTIFRDGANIHKISIQGEDCGQKLLNYLWSGSLTYFHNLKYDACFFINTPGWDTQITERSGTVLQIIMTLFEEGTRKVKKRLTFRNSYSIIPQALSKFATMFNLNVHKEVMAYKLYTQENIQRRIVDATEFQQQYIDENADKLSKAQLDANCKQIIENAKIANCYNDGKIDIIKYAIFYCFKDCIVLMKGMEKFNEDLKAVFKETKTDMYGVHDFISISAIGYCFAKKYGCFDGCYELSGKCQDFIQRCVSGGRTMTAGNEKQYIEGKIQDFDAVSLYPSAMYVMDGIPLGRPKVIPQGTTHEQLMQYDTFFIEVNIKKLECKSKEPYKFGQVFTRNEAGSKIFGNFLVDHYYIDKVGLMDLFEFYDVEYELIRGYYFDEGFNKKINEFIEKLFNLRASYKKQKNPLEQTIKLLLNSIYGKSILKATKTETKTVPKSQLYKYLWRNYNFIKEVVEDANIDKCYVKKLKPINDHFNLPQFGASVLSWSKHLMNRVMATAEQAGIPIFYQDTDSMHVLEKDVPRIADLFQFKYHQPLIGKNMCQFHNDFDEFEGSQGEIHSRKLIALGKKSYLDILVDEQGNEGYHIRLKGIPKQVILNKCKRMGISVEELFERMHEGESMTFDLLDGSNAFRKSKTFQQTNLPKFARTLRFT